MALERVTGRWHSAAMYACAACGAVGTGSLCPPCDQTLQPATPFRTPAGLVVSPAFRHRGAARRLVHSLKYAGIVEAGTVLASAMAALVPETATALVPVPRATARRWRHGVDPAVVLARFIGRRCGLPVVPALRSAWWWPRHAARGDERRSRARFTARVSGRPGWVLIDDVATSGATLAAAADALGRETSLALVATAPSRVSGNGGSSRRSRVAGGGVAERWPNRTVLESPLSRRGASAPEPLRAGLGTTSALRIDG